MKKTIATFVALTAAMAASAAPLTPQQALGRLSTPASGLQRSRVHTDASDLSLAHTSLTQSGRNAVYVFNRDGGRGYVLLSADDAARPVLGYSDSGSFSPDAMSDAMRWWLDEYARQIEYANAHGLAAYAAAPAAERQAIEPMLQTRWDQGTPFNNSTPLYGTERTYTGCVATSMAQVMKYWEYPTCGQGSITYTAPTIDKRLTLNFANRDFEWADMLNDYSGEYTEEQADAVAYLMRAAGYSVKMDYSTAASAALALDIANALKKYFAYDAGTRYDLRAFHSPSEWADIIYDNLNTVGPVIYGGTSFIGGGHSFVCDGYDGNGYFHFNWGWSGISDGYFSLEALAPSALGTGGGMGGGYNFAQDAVLGIQPPTGQSVEAQPLEIVQGGSLAADVQGEMLCFSLTEESGASWINYNPRTLNVHFGATFEPQGGGETLSAAITRDVVTLKAGYGTDNSVFKPQIDLAALDLPDGTYKVTFCTDIEEDPDNKWVPVHPLYRYHNSVTLSRAGNDYTVTATPVGGLHIVEGSLNNTLYYGGLANVTVKVSNPTDDDMTGGFAPALFQVDPQKGAQIYFLGESVMLNVEAHSTVEYTWTTNLYALQQIYGIYSDTPLKLTFFDEATYNFYVDDLFADVVMKPNAGAPQNATVSGFNIEGAVKKTTFVAGMGRIPVYYIPDRSNIRINFNLGADPEYPFCYEAVACLLSATADDNGYEILTFDGQPVFMEAGQANPFPFSTTLSWPEMEEGKIYLVCSAFIYGSTFVPLGNMYAISYDPLSAVEGVEADISDANAPLYNLQGIRTGNDADHLPAGIYIRNGKKIIKR